MEWRVNILRSRPRFAPETRRRYGMFYFRTWQRIPASPAQAGNLSGSFCGEYPRVEPRCESTTIPRNGKDPQGDGIRRAEAIRGVRRKGGLGQVGDGSSENVNVPINARSSGNDSITGAARSASLRVRWTRFTSPSQSTTKPAANATSWARRVTIQPRLVRAIGKDIPRPDWRPRRRCWVKVVGDPLTIRIPPASYASARDLGNQPKLRS